MEKHSDVMLRPLFSLVLRVPASSASYVLLLLSNMYWLRWHSHFKDIAGAPHNHWLAKKSVERVCQDGTKRRCRTVCWKALSCWN